MNSSDCNNGYNAALMPHVAETSDWLTRNEV